MFVFSLKASKIKMFCVLLVCVLAVLAVISVLPETGNALNVNKIEGTKQLSKINASTEKGRMKFFETLGYSVEREPVSKQQEKLPEEPDIILVRYNEIQRAQGYDLERLLGKKVESFTYKVTALPDNTKIGDKEYLATVIVYKNKVVAADLTCVGTSEYMPLVSTV